MAVHWRIVHGDGTFRRGGNVVAVIPAGSAGVGHHVHGFRSAQSVGHLVSAETSESFSWSDSGRSAGCVDSRDPFAEEWRFAFEVQALWLSRWGIATLL